MIKLIATDLDGTLMAPDHLTVTDRTYNALKTAHDKGIKNCRCYRQTYDTYRQCYQSSAVR